MAIPFSPTVAPVAPVAKKPISPAQTVAPPSAPGLTPPTPGAGGGSPALQQLLGAINTPLNTTGILSAAHNQALADTGSIVSTLRAAQASDNAQAAQRATELTKASLGAAQFLKSLNLGSGLATSLNQAAGDQASLASGFSGQLQQDVNSEAAKTQAALNAIGGSGTLGPNTSAQAGATVFGTGGLLPANAMTAAAPYAEAQANAAPGNLLAQGQQEAVGAIGAGKQQAAKLDPQIAAQIAKLPATEAKYVTQLTTAAEKSRQDAIGNVTKAISLQQTGDRNAATQAYDKARVSQAHANLLDKKAARISAAATKASQFAVTSGEKATHDRAMEKAASTRASASKIVGSDKAGRFEFNPATGTITPLGKLSKPVKGSARAAGSLTNNEAARLVSTWGTGTNSSIHVPTVDASGNPVKNTTGVPQFSTQTQTTGQRSYQQAIDGLVALGKPKSDAVKIVQSDPSYQPGTNGRPYTRPQAMKAALEGATAAFAAGKPYADALKAASASGKYPKDVLEAALRKVYYSGPYSPIVGSPHFTQGG